MDYGAAAFWEHIQ